MAKMFFYPLGNADSTLLHLNDGRLVLKDFFHPELEDDDKRIDLASELNDYVRSLDRDYIDVVAFSHADDDHLHGAEEFFWLEHAKKYQDENRVKIIELHVPANFITEKGLENTARVIQKEARLRLKTGAGIMIHGYPEQLNDWFNDEGIDPNSREDLIIHAGELIPGFNVKNGGVEIFVHSPFSFELEDEEENRNDNSLVWHITFFEGDQTCTAILGADAGHDAWANIVYLTEKNDHEEKLSFDLFRISHHCSYKSLSEDKGESETIPRKEVEKIFQQGHDKCILISSSLPIPDEDTDQPPHYQAKAYYEKVVKDKGNENNFFVTMEWRSVENPKPIIVETGGGNNGFTIKKSAGSFVASQVTQRQPPRVG